MSVVGFDFGNESCVVAVARQRGIDVVLNEESKRETPAVVSFGDKQRFIGSAGASSSVMNPKNSISQIKRFIGRKFADPELQQDLKSLPFKVSEGPDGGPLIHARYLGEEKTFTPTQILAMVLSNLKSIAEKNLSTAVVDCVIGIPIYFTDLQRRAVLDAASIAGLHPLRLFHETTATALGYGLYKVDLPENEAFNVAFVDVGHASMQVCIAAFKKGQLKVLAHAYDRSLGGRDFDEVLFDHFAAKFKEEYKIHVSQNARACTRLRVACEKLKKVLSANPEAPINIECLMDEKDVRGFIKRDEFEQISTNILQRVKVPLEKALADAGLSVDAIHAVEVVGSGSRIPAIIKIVTEFFGKEPRRTLNASECVARGCALQCAILSPTFKVREFQVQESFPFSIGLFWKATSETPNGSAEDTKMTVVFPKGETIPQSKVITFFRHNTFTVDFMYVDGNGKPVEKISTYQIGPFQSATGERAKLKVKVQLNIHGIVSVDSAHMIEEEVIETPVATSNESKAEKMETDEASKEAPGPADADMQDAKGAGDAASAGADSGATGTEEKVEDKPVQMETDAKADAIKKKVKKTNVPTAGQIYGGLLQKDLQTFMEKEGEMALQDKVMEDTKDRKNAVEAYVYAMRSKLFENYQDFVADADRESFSQTLQDVEDWLYDEGEDETKGVYINKLQELRKIGDPIEDRYRESLERGPSIQQLEYCIRSFREAAHSQDPRFDHIDAQEKEKVLVECAQAESWLMEKKQQQDVLPKYAPPVLFSADVRRKAEALDRFCKPIMTKPKPAPPKPQTPPPAEAPQTPQQSEQDQQQPAGSEDKRDPMADDADSSARNEPMDTDRQDNASTPAA